MLVQEGIYLAAVPVSGALKTVNCYLLKDAGEAYLVDTAWRPDGNWDHLLHVFRLAGLEPRRLTGIIMTHGHSDHVGHVQAVQDLTGAPVLIHRAEKQGDNAIIGRDKAWRRATISWLEHHGVPPDLAAEMVCSVPISPQITLRSPRWLSGGEVISVGAMRWETLWTPGHSPGHICLFERRRGVLITGDHVLPHETPNVSVHPNMPVNPLGRYIDSLREIQSLNVQQALPGHGNVFTDVQLVIAQLISHHGVRFADVLSALRAGPLNAFTVACEIPWVQRAKRFWQLSPRDRFLAFGESIAHLECLEGCGKVQRLESKSQTLWTLLDSQQQV